MKQLNRPIRKNYPTTFSYNVDLLFYYLKKNRLLFIIIFAVIILSTIGIFTYSLIAQNNAKKSLVLMESVYDNITLYIDKYSTINNKQELRANIDPVLEKIIKKYPNTLEFSRAHYYLSLMDYLDGNYENCIMHLKKIQNKKTHFSVNVYFGLVQSYLSINDFTNAEKYALLMYKKFKKNNFGALACYLLGKIYEIQKDPQKALDYYHKIEKDYGSSYLAMDQKIKNNILLYEIESKMLPNIE
jgi:tetratricopeptide (TPR) repeat protein